MISRCGVYALALTGLFTGASAISQAQLSIAPREGVLVLRNGYVMSGRITPQGDYYLVTFGDSSEARLPADQVELVCRSIEEAYFLKRDRLNRADLQSHLRLAEWCLRHKLLARAADQILSAMIIDPTDRRIDALKRRLQNAAIAAGSPDEPSGRNISSSGPTQAEPMLSGLPSGAVERFTQTVQPVLLNRCATNACHGSGAESQLRLHRPRLGRTLTRRTTQRNMLMALKFVDLQTPLNSRLLTAIGAPHGGLAGPVFAESESEPIAALVGWIGHFSGGSLPTQVAADVPATAAALSDLAAPGSGRSPGPSGNPQSNPRPDPEASPTTRSASLSSQDPFDPEIFNRRHSPRRSTSVPTANSSNRLPD